MATIPGEVERVVKEYVSKVSSKIPVKKAFLFGSYAKGNFRPDSDIDVAFISDHFEEMNRVEGITFLVMEAMDYDIDIEPLPFSEKDIQHPVGLIEEILKTGIEIQV